MSDYHDTESFAISNISINTNAKKYLGIADTARQDGAKGVIDYMLAKAFYWATLDHLEDSENPASHEDLLSEFITAISADYSHLCSYTFLLTDRAKSIVNDNDLGDFA